MTRFRVILFSFLICLPAALLIAAGAVLVAAHVPKAIRAEPGRIGREYRDVAESMAERPAAFASVAERPKGWRQAGKVNGAPWGYTVDVDVTTVWWRQGERDWRVAQVPVRRPFPYAAVFYGGGALVALVLVTLSAFAVVCFVRFMRERDDFLAATAHDLTTPLVGLRFMVGRDAAEARRLVERLLLIVGNIKDFLRLGGRRKAPEKTVFDLAALTREAAQLFAADYAEEASGPVSFGAPPTGGLPVCADETWTLQILWNLFGNDLKYAAPYGTVAVRFRREAAFACVDFADEGQGMTARQMRRAFDRYYRARTVLTSGKGGFGIGLCTARSFARAMGGDLSVRANRPKGCVFTLKLPSALS